MSSAKFLFVIEGPTAIGKTGAAIAVARAFETAIISADARQIFRRMEIGTAAPTEAELASAPHHLVGFLEPTEVYSAGAFERDALALLQQIYREKDCAVVAGGSGLYVKALLRGLDQFPPVPASIREELIKLHEAEGVAPLQQLLAERDPNYWEIVDRQNPQRLIRALEVFEASGKPYSTFLNDNAQPDRPFRPIRIALEMDREQLYQRINLRVDKMLELGLLDECKALQPLRSAHPNLNALQTVGYREIFDWMDGKYASLDQAVEKIKQHSRNYAKRQLTWLRKQADIQWFSPLDIEGIIAYLREQSSILP